MENYNDAIIGNQNILSKLYKKNGELLRMIYPTRDYKQMIDFSM